MNLNKNELGQLYWLNKETAQLQKELSELRQKEMYRSPTVSDMPKGSSKQDSISNYIVEIMILEDMIKINIQKIYLERAKLEKYISEISDSETRLILRLRYVNGMKFEEIGQEINMSKSSVHRKYNKLFKECIK